ncbi:proton myo-inositol cotransporter-like protein [Turdus rufiventris]|nr:proton myo-inositol cotransporter-like protein [Turdus rufiventris]
MSRKASDNVEYTLRSLSNLMGEKRRRQADGSAGSGAAAGERSLIAAESCSSLNSAASGGELERAARRQFQQDETPGFVYVVSVFSALGGFLFGYDTGVVSGALLLLKRELNLDALWQELLVSGTVGAAALSALAGGVLNGLCGRRPCILLASGLFTAGSGVLAAARDKETLLAGRVVVGLGIGASCTWFSPLLLPLQGKQNWSLIIALLRSVVAISAQEWGNLPEGKSFHLDILESHGGCGYSIVITSPARGPVQSSDVIVNCLKEMSGVASMTVPVYIAEVAPPHLRGRLVTINTLFITGGQFFASVVDGIFSYLSKDGWRYMLGLSAVPAVIQFLGFLFLPESPRWLIQKGQTQRARRILSQMRGNQAIDEEYDSIKNNIEEEEKEVGAVLLSQSGESPKNSMACDETLGKLDKRLNLKDLEAIFLVNEEKSGSV